MNRSSVSWAALIVLLGTLSSAFGYVLVRERAQERHRTLAQKRALELTSALESGFLVPMEVLHSIPALFDASEEVGRSEFRAFVRHSLDRWPEIYALEWFPRVVAERRAEFEQAAKKDGYPDFQFTEVGDGGRMVRAGSRPEHLPLFYMEPANRVALGFDLTSERDRVAPALKARDTGLPVLSPRIRLVEDSPSVYSIAAFSPVFKGIVGPADQEQRRRPFLGVAAIVFRVKPVVERVLKGLDLERAEFVVTDLGALPSSELLYESRPGLAATLPQRARESQAKISLSRHEIRLGDRRWQLTLLSPPAEHAGAALLAAGISLSLLLGLVTGGAIAFRELRRRVGAATQLGQYTVVSKIGEGGMGVVYRARHALLSRPTAIKLLPPSVGEERLRRFEREAELTSELTHPNTVVVYDYGRTADGTLYYVMEYLDGITLEQLVHEDGPQPPARVVQILTQVCGALAEAHSIGLIHRDIKPANLMLTVRGQVADFVKVLDFGLVKQQFAPSNVSLSGVHALVGTPAYLPPEAIQAPERVDARSDIYSLGAVAYFLLTGSLVFEGSSVVELCSHHMFDQPVPPSVRSGLPIAEALEQAVLRCLAKSPDARFQTAKELEAKLRDSAAPDSWSRADAERWWQARASQPPGEWQPESQDAPRTVAVDLARRRAPRAKRH